MDLNKEQLAKDAEELLENPFQIFDYGIFYIMVINNFEDEVEYQLTVSDTFYEAGFKILVTDELGQILKEYDSLDDVFYHGRIILNIIFPNGKEIKKIFNGIKQINPISKISEKDFSDSIDSLLNSQVTTTCIHCGKQIPIEYTFCHHCKKWQG